MEESSTGNIVCPVCGGKAPVYTITPDSALLDVLWHGMYAHPEIPALMILDQIELNSARGLIPNGV